MTQEEITKAFTEEHTYICDIHVPKWGVIGKWLGLQRRVPLNIITIPCGKVQLIGSTLSDMLGIKEVETLPQSEQINSLLAHNIQPIANIIGLASLKGKKKPSEEYVQSIMDSLSMDQLNYAMTEVYRRLDLKPFFDIMALTKSLSLNLFPEAEAPGQQS